jgi:hypothetical protein
VQASRVREIRTHGSTGRGPATDSRRRLHGHEAGNGGHCQVRAYGAPRRPPALPHHPEKGLHRRDDRGRHGPAVAGVPAGHQRAPTTLAHAPLRGGAGPGERRARLAPQPQAAATSDEPGRRITRGATAPGRSFWRGPSRWTSSPAPGARGRRGCSRWSKVLRASPATSPRWARRPRCLGGRPVAVRRIDTVSSSTLRDTRTASCSSPRCRRQ